MKWSGSGNRSPRSWFRYAGAGKWKWNWQRDFFDFGQVSALYTDLLGSGQLPEFSQAVHQRIQRSVTSDKAPGYYPLGKSPVPLWGEFVTEIQ